MPGYELWSDKERKEVNDVLNTGILMRYGFDGMRNGIWKSKELEAAICETFGTKHAQLVSVAPPPSPPLWRLLVLGMEMK